MRKLQDIALTWFKDHLTNRTHYVTYNAIKSTKEYITCGVPQGSILGPLLFLLYVNDLAVVSNAFWSVLSADDTSLFISGKDAWSMCVTINNDLSKIQKWLYCNKLSLNVLKTHYMIFKARNKTSTDLDIKINEVCIERVYETKFLGVLVDSQLTWKYQIDYTCKKLSKFTGILSKTRKKLHRPSLLTLYYSFAYPYLIYCNQVWGNNYPTVLNILLLVQKRLVRIITCSPFRTHTEPFMYAQKCSLLIGSIHIWWGYLCTNVYIKWFLKYFLTSFRQMKISMITILVSLKNYMYHMADFMSGDSVSKFMELMCGILYLTT